jgi:hypothetical protein
MDNINALVPEQDKGGKTDTAHTIHFKKEQEAKNFFLVAKQRLQDVNRWHEIAGTFTAGFQLLDESGHEVSRLAKTGDYFQINIPAPGPGAGDGYDWVRVELMEEQAGSSAEEEAFGLRVRPAAPPANHGGEEVAHFFKDDATSSFLVERKGTAITAAVRGRNEVPNASSDKPLDMVRNAVVGIGAILGLSNPQWKSLVKGILKHE